MPLIRKSVSLPASATNENLITGSEFEYLPFNAAVEIAVVALSGNFGEIVLDVTSGTDILASQMSANVRSTGINVNDDPMLEDIALQGDRLKIRARNTTAGAIVVDVFVRITPQ